MELGDSFEDSVSISIYHTWVGHGYSREEFQLGKTAVGEIDNAQG